PAVSTPNSTASLSFSMPSSMANHSPVLKSGYQRPESGAQFVDNEKERGSSRKKPTLNDLYESNHGLKRRFTPSEISDLYSYKKTIRDLKQDNNGSGHSEHHSDDEDIGAFGGARTRPGDMPSPSLKSSLASPSLRPSEASHFPNFSQSLSVSKSNLQDRKSTRLNSSHVS